MFYVIARNNVHMNSGQPSSFKRAEIVSRHKNDWTATERREAVERRTDTFQAFAVIQSNDDLAPGDVCEGALQALLDAETEAESLAIQLVEQERGVEIENVSMFSIRLEEIGLRPDELLDAYRDKAEATLDQRDRTRQAKAEARARVEAIQADLSERSEITYSFPAVRGIQAGREYYVAQVPYRFLVKLFVFDEELLPPETRAQRQLNERHARDIAEYVCENCHDYVLPALTTSVSSEMSFEAAAVPGASDRVGMLHIPLDAILLINDGQHRRRGIELALAQQPALKDETISVTIFYDRGLERSQQMFADINANAKKPSSSLNALYDKRDRFNQWVLRILDDLPEIRSRIEMESASVGRNSMKLWSLVGFKKFVANLTGVTKHTIQDEAEQNLDTLREGVVVFLRKARACIPMWEPMLSHAIPAPELRETYVVGHAVFLEALGLFGREIMAQYCDSPVEAAWEPVGGLCGIIPERASRFWEGRCVVNGRMQKTADGVKGTAAVLLSMAQLPLTGEIELVNTRILEHAA